MTGRSGKSRLLKTFLVIVLMFTVSLLFYGIQKKLLGSELGSLGYLGVFLLSVVGNASVLLPVPSLASAVVGGALLNPFIVGLVSSFGATIGEMTGYIAGRAGRVAVGEMKQFQKMRKKVATQGLWGIAVLAAVPNPLFDMAGIVAGMMRIPLKQFFLAVWVGLFVKYLTFSLLGSRLFAFFHLSP